MSTVIYIHKVVPSYLRCRCPCVFVAVSRSSQSVSTEAMISLTAPLGFYTISFPSRSLDLVKREVKMPR